MIQDQDIHVDHLLKFSQILETKFNEINHKWLWVEPICETDFEDGNVSMEILFSLFGCFFSLSILLFILSQS